MVSTKCLSLVEQKRLQWAREREELAGLCAPWGPPSNQEDRYRTCIRTRFLSSTTDLTGQELHQQEKVRCSYNYTELTSELQAAAARMRRKRTPSLPPICSRTTNTCQDDESVRGSQQYENRAEQEEEGEGETSGYASDSGGNPNDRNNDMWNQHHQQRHHCQDYWMSENQRDERMFRRFNRQTPWIPSNRRYGTPDSAVSTPPFRLWSSGGSDEVNRLRWGDRGVGVGHLWEPTLHEPDSRLPQVQTNGRGTPGWLERGLNKLGSCDSSTVSSTQVLVINHDTPEQSTLSRELAGSCDTISTQSQSECNRTFIRGQNAPVEPEVLLERERKRQKALEHQNAIRLQLEERERKRKEEKERRIREEREEEERIKHQKEIERKRIEEEQKRLKEREEKEVRKAAAMREALENAEKKAREEKSLASRKHVLEYKQDTASVTTDTYENNSWLDSNSIAEHSTTGNTVSTAQNVTEVKDSVTKLCNATVPSKSFSTVPAQNADVRKMHDGTQTGIQTHNEALLISAETVTMPADSLAVVLGTSTDINPHEIIPNTGGVQLALLMSPSMPQPLMLENRLLTPSLYRAAAGRERGTQTDSEFIKGSRGRCSKDKTESQNMGKNKKKSASLERPHHGCKLPLRCRSQSQPTQPRMRLEDRPKWGVNRPETQYIKQSEKDPYYQRRLRQRLLRTTIMVGGDTGTESDTGSHHRPHHTRGSSDDNSRSPSPQQRPYHSINKTNKNVYYHHRKTNVDRNANNVDDHDDKSLVSAIGNEQLDNKSEIPRNNNYTIDTTSKQVQVAVHSLNINQHFTENTAKRKGTQLHTSGHGVQPSASQYFSVKGSQRLLNRQNELPITVGSSSEAEWSTAKDVLTQLSSLRQGLIMKKQEWDSSRSYTPYSESSWNS